MKVFIFISLFLSAIQSVGQLDTNKTRNLEHVIVRPVNVLFPEHPLESERVSRNEIQETQPEDLGQLLRKFPGVSLKSYGGLGGLKTFSFRSLGSQHTSVVVDGFSLQNAQSGQVNLGQIHTSNIEYISLGKSESHVRLPVSSLVMANEMNMNTFEGRPEFNKTLIRASVKAGSFGQTDNYFAFKSGKKKLGFTVHGKYRQAKGDYPYNLQIGDFNYAGIQNNNELKELYSGFSLYYRPNEMKQAIRLIYRNTFINQELPGAVILYNNSKGQYLSTQKHNIAIDWQDKWGFTNVRYYASYQYDDQGYLDSNYFNASGVLKRDFFQNNGQLGWRFERKKFGELLSFYGGVEQQYATLKFGGNDEVLPTRYSTFSNAGFLINEKKYKVDMRIGYQLIGELKSTNKTNLRHLWAPVLNFETKERGKRRWKYGFSTSTTVRLPSFNELYYAQVGNEDLEPEKAKQVSLFTGIARKRKTWFFSSKVLAYFNQIDNKILAIPTKNLFVWSIQNVDKVNAIGIDFGQVIRRAINSNWNATVQLNYSFQYSVSAGDKSSPSFGDQIAYIPYHTANTGWSIDRKNTSLRISGSFVGGRYSLNENIPSNYLDPFLILDASLNHKVEIKNRHKLNFQFQIKNILGENYTYIRSFVMPGRNFLISLNYEI